jgi:hypothetical protein
MFGNRLNRRARPIDFQCRFCFRDRDLQDDDHQAAPDNVFPNTAKQGTFKLAMTARCSSTLTRCQAPSHASASFLATAANPSQRFVSSQSTARPSLCHQPSAAALWLRGTPDSIHFVKALFGPSEIEMHCLSAGMTKSSMSSRARTLYAASI